MRYFVRHPTTQLMPRKVKTAFTAPTRTARSPASTTSPSSRASATACAASRCASAAARRSCRASRRRCTSSSSADDGEYLKVAEAVLRIFDRQEWLRANRARARIKVFVDKFGIDELRRQVDEELEGDWVNERDFTPDPLLFDDDEEAVARAVPATYASPNGDRSEFERWTTPTSPPAPGRLQHRRGPRPAAAT